MRNEVTDLTITFKKLEKSQIIMIHIVLPGIQTFIFFICSSILLLFHNLKANDSDLNGGGGGILFPVFNDNISVRKEILKISYSDKRKVLGYDGEDNPIHVDIEYEFFNHGQEQDIIIGFEAMLGGEEQDDIPEIANFVVLVNGGKVNHKSKLINDPYAVLNNDKANWIDSLYSKDTNYTPNRYIKYFKAYFKHGINKISHSYDCDYTSDAVGPIYSYSYDLMPALRWKNRQIDDFTLILDFGDYSHFLIEYLTKSDGNKWTFTGNGKVNTIIDTISSYGEDSIYYTQYSNIYCKEGKVEFRCKDFKPINNLSIIFANPINSFINVVPYELSLSPDYDDEYDNNLLLKEYFNQIRIDTTLAKKIYRNLPFARRGYIFKDKLLSDFYKKHTSWYEPNPKYNGNVIDFSKMEKKIIQKNSLIFREY